MNNHLRDRFGSGRLFANTRKTNRRRKEKAWKMDKKASKGGTLARRGANKAVAVPAGLEGELRAFWLEKYRFSISKLQLSQEKARAWATRAVRVKSEVKNMELQCSLSAP
jgi:hypothetical protein